MIIGAGGHARVVAETALSSGIASRIAFLDDQLSSNVLGWPVLGPLDLVFEEHIQSEFNSAVVGLGQSDARMRWLHRLELAGYQLPLIVHHNAFISPSAYIGSGSVVFSHAVVQSEAVIGSGVILNTASTVDHNAHLGNGVHVSPGAHLAGEVYVGDRSWIGLGASIIQQIRIGAGVTVGAGAVVVRDLPDGVTAVGVPARVL